MDSKQSHRLRELNRALGVDGLGSDIVRQLLGPNENYADLISDVFEADAANKEMYDNDQAVTYYRNFLDWLFATFRTDENDFRAECLDALGLSPGARVLITSCGLGEDAEVACALVGESGFVHAQDLSASFIRHAAQRVDHSNLVFTVSNALALPYRDDYFDGVFHFGGINLFGDLGRAVSEMNRVCRVGGRVVFGDESVAPHLRDSDYGKMMIENNPLWEATVPLNYLPVTAQNISLKFVLGSCFYLLGFEKSHDLPDADIDVAHKGSRGGSIRTRYFGKLEGIDPELRSKIYGIAQSRGTSVSAILEDLIRDL